MKNNSFDRYADKYDAWLLENKNVLYSGVKLVAHFLKDTDHILSVGCGSSLFDSDNIIEESIMGDDCVAICGYK